VKNTKCSRKGAKINQSSQRIESTPFAPPVFLSASSVNSLYPLTAPRESPRTRYR
jgi:hypothetical protein